MTRLKLTLLILLAIFSGTQAQSNGLLVYNVWVRPTAPALADSAAPQARLPGTVTGAYMTIENTSESDYELVSVTGDFVERSQVHEMRVDSDGMSGMRVVDALEIPAGETTILASGSYHVMLENVLKDIYPGQAIPLTMTFAAGDGVTFDMQVGAMATDFPPDQDPLIVGNPTAWANSLFPETLVVVLILDNRGDQADKLMSVTSDLPGMQNISVSSVEQATGQVLSEVDVPAQTLINLALRLSNFTQLPSAAFPLSLTFESGKTIIVAVPLVETVSPEASGSYQTLTIDEFADILANRSDEYAVVNVHIPYEGEVENTDMKIAYNDIEALTAALPNTSAPIILYCRSGSMSAEAAQVLADLGYSQIWDVPGGMNAWTASGRELLDNRPTEQPNG